MTVQEENPENISASGVIDASVIDAKITELKKDPRVKHVQEKFYLPDQYSSKISSIRTAYHL